MPIGDPLTVLYDADCGFCQHTAAVLRRLDRRRSLRFVPLQDAEAIPGVPDRQRLMAAMHVVDGAGRWSTGGAAWVRIAETVPALVPLALLARLPGASVVVELGYRLIAANRHRLSRWLGESDCRLR